jgi:predicted membrane protein
MLSFFIFVFALRAVFPVLLFLGRYTTDRSAWKRIGAISGIVAIWGVCLALVLGVPLIPGVVGVVLESKK